MDGRITPQEFSSQLAKQYGYERWASPTQSERTIFINNFFLWGNEFGADWVAQRLNTAMIGSEIYTSANLQHRSDLFSLRIEIYETASATKARSRLLELLHEFAVGPLTRQKESEAVHIGFATRGGKAVVYAFANMAVKLTWYTRGGERDVNTHATVQKFTSIFAEKSHTADKVRQPEIVQLQTPMPRMKPGVAVPLDIRVIDPLNRPVWYRLTSTNGEITSQGERLMYTPFTTGRQSIVLVATNADGFTSQRELRLV